MSHFNSCHYAERNYIYFSYAECIHAEHQFAECHCATNRVQYQLSYCRCPFQLKSTNIPLFVRDERVTLSICFCESFFVSILIEKAGNEGV
jgi:hypothetical protein